MVEHKSGNAVTDLHGHQRLLSSPEVVTMSYNSSRLGSAEVPEVSALEGAFKSSLG